MQDGDWKPRKFRIDRACPGYTTIALFYDPVRVVDAGAPSDDIVGWLKTGIESILRGS